MTRLKKLSETAMALGADNVAFINVSDISFKSEFRAACEQNTCGKYGRCWMCPPDAGDIGEMIAKAKAYKKAFIFQTISPIKDSFDIEGMQAAAKRHNELLWKLAHEAGTFIKDFVKLGAGACQVCERCAKIDKIPCRNPRKAAASLEAYGIDVSELAKPCGMNYINGQNTVTYFGGFLFT